MRQINELCEKIHTKNAIFSPDGGIRSRLSRVSAVRAVIAVRSKNELGPSGAEIARHLGVNTSSINRALARAEGAEGQ